MQRSLTTERHRPRHASTKNPVQTLIPATSGGRALILPSHFSLVTVRCSHVVLSCHDIPCDLLSGWEVDRCREYSATGRSEPGGRCISRHGGRDRKSTRLNSSH